MTRREWDLHPMDEPEPVVTDEVVEDQGTGRIRAVRIACGIINLICGVFAVVLGLHIILVLAEANPGNGFAQLIASWSSAVSLGLRNLFVPASEKVRVLLNDGMAAIAWLLIAAALTYAIRMFALPGRRRERFYVRRMDV